MIRDGERQKTFTRRALLLAGGQTTLFCALAGRLYYLQVMEADRYTTLAEENRINIQLLAPARGRILDRRGRMIAVNRPDYRVMLIAEQAGDVPAALQALGNLIPLTEADTRRVLRDIRRNRRFVPVMVRESLSWEQVARIEVYAIDIPGLVIEEAQGRFYPYGDTLSHVLGYVGAVAEGDAADDPLLRLPGFRIGKAGLERVYDLSLRGSGGRSEVEVNSVGRTIRELERKDGHPGSDLDLSLDLELQQLAYQLLEGQSGAAVLMDVQTGEVLALASVPGFDPNVFSHGISGEEWRSLLAHPRKPLSNKAVSGQYAPGSTFKVLVALAGLERGTITPQTRVSCNGGMHLGNHRFHCWRRGGHGTVDVREALIQSCDVFFYEAARRTGIERISALGRRFGLGAPVGVDLPFERGGLLPTPEWKSRVRGAAWTTGETIVAGIGQGYVLATPLQLATMTARIANGGRMVTPRLARRSDALPESRDAAGTGELIANPAHMKLIQDGMIGVVNSARGTAKAAAIREAGREMAGKTGTSQVRRISQAERLSGVRKNENLPWEKRDHALFIGYAPVDAPRYAVAVIVEHGGGGSKVAAPIARDLLLAAQKLESLGVA